VAKQTEFQQALGCELSAAPGCLECFVLFLAIRDLRSLGAQLVSDSFRILRGAKDVRSDPAEFRFIAADSAPGLTP
jgi:hypothetical protein